jgi:hypothetical protein
MNYLQISINFIIYQLYQIKQQIAVQVRHRNIRFVKFRLDFYDSANSNN